MHSEMGEVFCGLEMSGATEVLRARAKLVRELCRGKGGGEKQQVGGIRYICQVPQT